MKVRGLWLALVLGIVLWWAIWLALDALASACGIIHP